MGIASGVAGGLLQVRTDTSVESFLPAGDPAVLALEEAARSFGGDPLVVIVESATEPDMEQGVLAPAQLPQLLRVEGELSRLPDVAAVYGPATVLNQIAASAQNMLASLSGRRDATRHRAEKAARERGAAKEEITAAGDAAVEEFDDRYGRLLVRGLPAGLPTLRNPAFVKQVIFDDNGEPKSRWDFVVPRKDTVSILIRPRAGLDQAGTERLVADVRATLANASLATRRTTVTGVPVVTAALGTQVRQEILLVGGIALAAIAASYLAVPWTRRRWRRLLPLMATLAATALVLSGFGWLGWPLSLGVIAFLPILLGIASDFPAYLLNAVSIRRVVVVALASAAAFASLAFSPLPFVGDLGLALAAGQLLALLAAVWYVRWRRKGGVDTDHDRRPGDGESHGARGDEGAAAEHVPDPGRGSGGHGMVARGVALALLSAVAAVGWLSFDRMTIEANPIRLAEGMPETDDIRHAERVLGASGELQLLVRGDVATPEALRWMKEAERALVVEHGDDLQPILTPRGLLDFLGTEPNQSQIDAGLRLLPEYLTHAVVRGDRRQAAMNFRLAVQDLADQKQLIEQVRAELPATPEGLDVEVVGLSVAASRAYELMSADRYLTSMAGLAGAGLVLLVGLSRRTDAVRAIFAAVLAVGWGLACAWALGVTLTPLTIVLGSLTTAIACEYSALFGGVNVRSAGRLRRTVCVAALSAALGYLSLLLSGLAVLREFGAMLAGAVALSFLAAIILNRLLPGRTATSGSAEFAERRSPHGHVSMTGS
ncbi:RND transporter [Haloechinothrix salitolerans]|uniref:RND transporter n=1 Tax=Haloechinothrix salitolerans TaxID=926830 RepID=A0ABW2BX82_9PSEU